MLMTRTTPLLTLALCVYALLPHAAMADEATPQEPSAIDQRLALEWDTYDNPFAITPHRPTYILPLAYSDNPNNEVYAGEPLVVGHNEIKIQFSFKVPLVRDLIFGQGLLSFGYTQQSFWQAYNGGDQSSPFRETNHEPELLLSFPSEYRFGKFRGRLITLGLNHQSNGRSEPLSRSWNRVMCDFVLERDGTYISFKPWWRVPEETASDNNPDIEDYLGHFELRALRKFSDHSLGLMVRNNLQSDNKGAVQIDYTYRLNKRLWGYVQIFNGYGESLIDYNHYGRSIGVGVMLANWL